MRFKLYLIIGVVFAFLLGLTWSLGPGLRYITVGISAYFFFLSVWGNPFFRISGDSRIPFQDLSDDLKIIFSPKKDTYTQQTGIPRRQKLTVIMIASFFIFFVFLTIIIAVIFLSDAKGTSESNYLESAEFYRTQGDYDSAIVYYHRSLRSQPGNREGRVGMGNAFLSKSTYDSALFYYNLVLKEDGEDTDALYNRSLVQYYQKDYKKSVSGALHVLSLDSQYENALLLAGDNYYTQQQYDSAIYWYEKGYETGARSAILCHVMAYIYDVQGNTDKAIGLYQEAVYYDSTKVDVYQRLGELLPEERGKYKMLEQRFTENQ